MLTPFLKALAARAAEDARAIQRRYLPGDTARHLAETSARALTRSWLAATAIAEAMAARHARSAPSEPPEGAPLRVLLAARLGAIGPAEEALVLETLGVLERLAAEPRTRPLEITLAGTRALTGQGGRDKLAARIFSHRVVDATTLSAAEVASWVGESDLVLTGSDLSPEIGGPLDVELTALVLGFARARGIPALGLGIVSPPERFSPEALAFLRRFGAKARLLCATPECAAAALAAGLSPVEVAQGESPPPPADGAILVLDAAPPSGGAGLGTSLAGEVLALGALLAGRRATVAAPSAKIDAGAVAEALSSAGHRVRRVYLGSRPDQSAVESVASGEDLARFLGELPRGTRVVCLAPSAAPRLLAAGHRLLSPATPFEILPSAPPPSTELAVSRLIAEHSPPARVLALPPPSDPAASAAASLASGEVAR